jgi:hypothetical protein
MLWPVILIKFSERQKTPFLIETDTDRFIARPVKKIIPHMGTGFIP